MDGKRHLLAVPEQKITKAINIISRILSKKKATVKELQSMTGLLNFLNRAIVPGRAFTRRMYAKFSLTDQNGNPLKHYHHVKVNQELKSDCKVWLNFLTNARDNSNTSLCCPFIDMNKFVMQGFIHTVCMHRIR